ncbi:MAG: ferritin family protein [Candidatus Methanofastidiosa archaeon]|nr:ferritin family protein [Candidatus Methanofastidiosa archaeon]
MEVLKINEALDMAIKTEKDGIKFYTKAAEGTKDALGKKMFLSFVEDEKRHLDILKKLSCDEHVCIEDIEDYSPRENLRTIFSDMPEDIRKMAVDASSDIVALEVAMQMERLGYDQYMKAAKESDDKELKEIFEKLAFEEKEHYDMLDEAMSYLEDTGNWYMWYEYSFPT